MSLDMSDIMTSGFYNDVYGYLMGKAYGLLPYAISAIILLFFRYNNFLFIILSLLNLMSVSYFIFIFGNRGAAIALLLTPIFFYFIKKNQSNICLFRLFLYLIISVIFLALFVYCFEQFLYPVISSNNIVFQSYEKNLKLIELGNILNGRDLIISKVLSYIMDKPLLGYGIGSVMEITGFNYPHNFALQFLFEGGIILAMPIIYLLINSFKLMFSANVSLNDKTFIFFLFQSSVIQLSFSSYPWQSQIFWLFIGTVIKVNNNLIPTKKIA
jgi:O-antigen ligase